MSKWLSPDVIASAPGRVNLIGEHIDYSQGFVLPFAISYRTIAALRRRDDQIIRVRSKQRVDDVITTSISALAPGSQGGWERYVLGVIWALDINEGVDIEIDGGKLVVRGNIKTEEQDDSFLFKGIANRAFTRSFALNDEVEVRDAEIFNGMLKIALERLVPEQMKPKKVPVKTRGKKQLLREDSYDEAAERL